MFLNFFTDAIALRDEAIKKLRETNEASVELDKRLELANKKIYELQQASSIIVPFADAIVTTAGNMQHPLPGAIPASEWSNIARIGRYIKTIPHDSEWSYNTLYDDESHTETNDPPQLSKNGHLARLIERWKR